MSKKEIRVFYSWQSDLPNETNRRAIRTSIQKAIDEIEVSLDVQIILDEATRDVSGSPNIPGTIIEKIENSAIFVGDVSIINSNVESSRACPNPNVVYELGYATRELGWNRIIMLFNKNYGNFPNDLPFDFDRPRVSPYKITDKNDKDGKNSLTSLLITALSSVIKNNPKRASERKEISDEEKKKLRNIHNIKWIMSTLHIPTIQDHIDNLPYTINVQDLKCWEQFNGVKTNKLFHLYDKEFDTALSELHSAWANCVKFSEHYWSTGHNKFIFGNPDDSLLTESQQRDWDIITENRSKMLSSLEKVLSQIWTNYVAIDILETNKQAWEKIK